MPDHDESFSRDIKAEVMKHIPRKDESCQAVMDGIIMSSGADSKQSDNVIDYVERLLMRESVSLYSDVSVYKDTGINRYFLRGVFLACGYCSDPSIAYRIELHIKESWAAPIVEDMLAEADVPCRRTSRGSVTVIYITNGDAVSDFLGIIGADLKRLEFENKRAEREVIGNVTRAVNCDSGNTKRQAEAGAARNELISKLMASEAAASLPPELAEAARVNLENPGASIAELGKLMDPPIGKSGMNHRIQKLLEIAKSID